MTLSCHGRRAGCRSPVVGDLLIFREPEDDIEVIGIVYKSCHIRQRVWIKWTHNSHNGYHEYLDKVGYPSCNVHNGYDRFDVIHGHAR